jgi:hypothetical protein
MSPQVCERVSLQRSTSAEQSCAPRLPMRLTEADRASPYGLPGIGVSAAPQSDDRKCAAISQRLDRCCPGLVL